MTAITAQTRYGVTIPKSFPDRKAALAWAEQNAWDGCRIVQATAQGLRTIWKHSERAAA